MSEVTKILESLGNAGSGAADELISAVYSQLRQIAAARMARESPGQTLQPTALVHEAWIRLQGRESPAYRNREHFFACAAEAMRRILIERARRRLTAKRGGAAEMLDVDELDIAAPTQDDDLLLELADAVDRFAVQHPEKAELVNLRYFVGLTFEEAAEALGIAVPTAKKWWAFGRAWLLVELGRTPESHAG